MGTTARNIYRLGPADNGLYKLADANSDNSTTEFRDTGVSAAPRTKTVAYPHWVPLTDQWDSLSISTLAFDPSDASGKTIFAGTGNVSSSYQSGDAIGLLKTIDGGATWSVVGESDLGLRGLKVTAIAFADPRVLPASGLVGAKPDVTTVPAPVVASVGGGALAAGRATSLSLSAGIDRSY